MQIYSYKKQFLKLPFQDQKLQKQGASILLLQPESSGHFQSIGRQAEAGSPW